MNHKVTKVHPADNVLVALNNLAEGGVVNYDGEDYTIIRMVPARHKHVIKVAGGKIEVSAIRHLQNNFIPWKRGVGL